MPPPKFLYTVGVTTLRTGESIYEVHLGRSIEAIEDLRRQSDDGETIFGDLSVVASAYDSGFYKLDLGWDNILLNIRNGDRNMANWLDNHRRFDEGVDAVCLYASTRDPFL